MEIRSWKYVFLILYYTFCCDPAKSAFARRNKPGADFLSWCMYARLIKVRRIQTTCFHVGLISEFSNLIIVIEKISRLGSLNRRNFLNMNLAWKGNISLESSSTSGRSSSTLCWWSDYFTNIPSSWFDWLAGHTSDGCQSIFSVDRCAAVFWTVGGRWCITGWIRAASEDASGCWSTATVDYLVVLGVEGKEFASHGESEIWMNGGSFLCVRTLIVGWRMLGIFSVERLPQLKQKGLRALSPQADR